MQFKEFDWLSGNGIWPIRYTMPYKYGKRTREFWGCFYFQFSLVFHDFDRVFNKTIIPLASVGYEMIITNSALRASLAI